MGAGTNAFQYILRLVMHAQNKDPGFRGACPEASCYLESAHPGHRDIQYHDIGMQLQGQGERLSAASGFANYLEFRLALQDMADTRTCDHVIVRHQHPDEIGPHESLAPEEGTRISSTTPLPAVPPVIRTDPPNAVIRSRIPANPM